VTEVAQTLARTLTVPNLLIISNSEDVARLTPLPHSYLASKIIVKNSNQKNLKKKGLVEKIGKKTTAGLFPPEGANKHLSGKLLIRPHGSYSESFYYTRR
jgi:hypothetical protein